MDASVETGYQPPQEFVEDKKEPFIDIELTDSTELWLIQWPINQPPDFEGQKVAMDLDGDGHLGTLEGSSGKSYEVISLKSQGPEPAVFLSSASEAKIAGKISRRISLIHYPEPGEFQRLNNLKLSQYQRSSAATSTLSGRRMATPTCSIKPKSVHKVSGHVTSTPNSTTKSSTQDSVKGNSVVTSTGSMEHSQERKSKKKKKNQS